MILNFRGGENNYLKHLLNQSELKEKSPAKIARLFLEKKSF
jgi:hypothetical protein